MKKIEAKRSVQRSALKCSTVKYRNNRSRVGSQESKKLQCEITEAVDVWTGRMV